MQDKITAPPPKDPSFWERVATWWRYRKGLGLVVPTLVFMMVSHGFFWSTVWVLDQWTSAWFAERHPELTLTALECLEKIPSGMCARLQEQLALTESRALHHYEISRVFQTYHFGFLSTAFWAGTMFALALVSVLQKGFDDLTSWGKGMMLGLLCTAAFFGGFPALMSLDKNIESNLSAYNAYDGISNEIRTYIRTGQSVTGNHVDGASFLHKMDLMFSDLEAPRIQLDASKVDLGKSRFMELSQEMEGGVITPSSEPVTPKDTEESPR